MQPILKIDLDSGEINQLPIPQEFEQDYIGGASLAAALLYDHLILDLDPLDSRAPLLFMNGPLSGTSGPAVGRFVVCARSPATRLWGESNCGGFWGPELRMAGFDGLWLTGRAEEPVYLWIQDGKVEIRQAQHLWGMDTYQTQTALEAELGSGKVRVASIGIAGENQIPFALILCDHGRVAGRTGMGAVMGSKNLKAIAVQGHGKVPVINLDDFNHLRSESNRSLKADNLTQMLREIGTAGAAEYFDYLASMPKKYFQKGYFEGNINISGAHIKDTILAGISACHACVIACGRQVNLNDGVKRKGPEYETLVGFGPNLMLNDPVIATQLGELCDRYGMDTISMSNIIGLAFHLFEMGKISFNDTGGLEFKWGEASPLETLIELTARKEGFGAYLAEGARALGRRFGAEEEAVQVNGLEVPYHDPRGSSGMALIYATSPRGACHNQSDFFMVDMGQIESELGMQEQHRLGGQHKPANIAIHQNWRTVFNSLVMCLYSNTTPDMVTALTNAASGSNFDLQGLLLAGERGWNLKRVMNIRLGLRREYDMLPKSFLQPYSDKEDVLESAVPDLQGMLEAYYAFRGWDPVTGFPTREKLLQLGLKAAAEDLYPQVQGSLDM